MKQNLAALIDRFGIESENFYEQINVRDQDAWLILNHAPRIFDEERIAFEDGVMGECHAGAAYLCLENPNWQMCFGIAEWGECVTEWGLHSWCLDSSGNLVEPTPLIRNRYIGIIVPDKIKLAYIWGELGTIKQKLDTDLDYRVAYSAF